VLLQQYYKLGYGYPINYEMSCPLIADMFHHMDDAVSGSRYVSIFTTCCSYASAVLRVVILSVSMSVTCAFCDKTKQCTVIF